MPNAKKSKPTTKPALIRIDVPETLKRAAKVCAAETGRTLTEMISTAITREIKATQGKSANV